MDEMTKDEILSVEAAPEKTAEPTEIDKVTYTLYSQSGKSESFWTGEKYYGENFSNA